VEVVTEYDRSFVWRDVSGMAAKRSEEGIPMSYSTVLGPWIIRGPNKPYETGESVIAYLGRLRSRDRVYA
jgi:hypothetical protein